MGFSVEESITVKMFDSEGKELHPLDVIIYKNREGRDMVARIVKVENGMLVLKNVTDEEEYKVRITKLGEVFIADVAVH